MISSNFTFNNVLFFFRVMLITCVMTGHGEVKSVRRKSSYDESSITTSFLVFHRCGA